MRMGLDFYYPQPPCYEPDLRPSIIRKVVKTMRECRREKNFDNVDVLWREKGGVCGWINWREKNIEFLVKLKRERGLECVDVLRKEKPGVCECVVEKDAEHGYIGEKRWNE